jgi:hypothetical protein
MERAQEHLGAERAARYLRKFYPWYVARLELPGGGVELNRLLQASGSIEEATSLLEGALEHALQAA